jgi:RNA recognition motif-containing protein
MKTQFNNTSVSALKATHPISQKSLLSCLSAPEIRKPSKKEYADGTTLFFGGVPKLIPLTILVDYFAHFGEIATIYIDKKEQRTLRHAPSQMHRGCGFVTFKDPRVAQAASKHDSHQLEGVYFEVRLALPQAIKKERDAQIARERRKVHITGIPDRFRQWQLRSMLIHYYGPLESCFIIPKDSRGVASGFAVFYEKFIADRIIGDRLQAFVGGPYCMQVEKSFTPRELKKIGKRARDEAKSTSRGSAQDRQRKFKADPYSNLRFNLAPSQVQVQEIRNFRKIPPRAEDLRTTGRSCDAVVIGSTKLVNLRQLQDPSGRKQQSLFLEKYGI